MLQGSTTPLYRKGSTLFEPFPQSFNTDSAFFDRIHAYLPGWEIKKLKENSFTKDYGFITDCFSEFCHLMRRKEFVDKFDEYFTLNDSFNIRDEKGVRRTFSGLSKMLFPDGIMTKDEIKELLEYSIECRRRVKEQLRRMQPIEFSDTELGYIDDETGEKVIVKIPEESDEKIISSRYEKPGYVYGIGKSNKDKLSLYQVQNKAIRGTRGLCLKNIEGSLTKYDFNASINYFKENYSEIIALSDINIDFNVFINDLLNNGATDELSIAEVVAMFSAVLNRPVIPAMVIYGKMVVSGAVMPLNVDLIDVITLTNSNGGQMLLLYKDCKAKFNELDKKFKNQVLVEFYETPLDAVKIALGLN